MERESNMQAPPALCRSGCGFYGNPATEGMCSVCFKEAVKKKQQPPTTITGRSSPTSSESGNTSSSAAAAAATQCLSTATTTVPTVSVAAPLAPQVSETEMTITPSLSTATSSSSLSSCVVDTDSDAGSVTNKDAKKKKNRCATCSKKVGLTGFECRCGGLYCSVHRYSDKHDCSFNYRELGAEEIRRNNPVVVGQKIQKI